MGHHGIAFITSAGQNQGRPEGAHFLKVRRPFVANHMSKDGAEHGILTDPGVKGIDQGRYLLFRDGIPRREMYQHKFMILCPGTRIQEMKRTMRPWGKAVPGLVLFLMALSGWGQQLVWSDEFQGKTESAAPDPRNWTYETGANGWGNHELEDYCAYGSDKHPCDPSQPNVFVKDGILHIVARRDGHGHYTSARLKSQGLKSFQYGRIEARIKIPKGQGFWPAFWMLGDNVDQVQWPACGELDIMENIGKEPGTIHGSIHGTGFTGEKIGLPYTLPKGAFGDDFHIFGLIWSPGKIQYYVDSPENVYATFTPRDLPKGAVWPFDQGRFFFLLNLAVGGDWPGPPDTTSRFPQEMLVDYVRVYASGPEKMQP